MWTRRELKERGKAAFKANYWWCVLAAVIMSILTAASVGTSKGDLDMDKILHISPAIIFAAIGVGLFFGIIIRILVKNVLIVGCNKFFIDNASGNGNINDIFYGYQNNFVNIMIVMLLKSIFVFLWSLLLIIPGIIKSYEYRMVPYLMATVPDITWKEAFAQSREMMNGNKWNVFVLDLSFIGWHWLSLFTCGLLEIFWTLPYFYATDAELYLELRK